MFSMRFPAGAAVRVVANADERGEASGGLREDDAKLRGCIHVQAMLAAQTARHQRSAPDGLAQQHLVGGLSDLQAG